MDKFKKIMDAIDFNMYMLQNPGLSQKFNHKGSGLIDIQSILFNKKIYTETEAKKWLKKNGYKNTKVSIGHHYYRFKQKNPKDYKKLRTDKISRGILFIYGIK